VAVIRSQSRNPWLRGLGDRGGFQCPVCDTKGALEHAYVGDLQARVGFLLLWCSHCSTAVNVSRVLIPEQEKLAYSFESAPSFRHLRLRELAEFEEL